mgnify:CR=1 FL=1
MSWIKINENEDEVLAPLTHDQLHTLCKVMSGLGAPTDVDDTGWCKDTWTEGNELASKDALTKDDAKQAAYILYKFAETQLPSIGDASGFKVNAKIMWATRQALKLSVIRYEDNFGARIALLGWFDQDANNKLRETMGFPAVKFDSQDKISGWTGGDDLSGAWSIQDKPEVVEQAVTILKEYDIDFSHVINMEVVEPTVSEQPLTNDTEAKIDARYKATLNIDAVELHWPFRNNNAQIREAIKEVDNWKFDMDNKCWRVPLSQAARVAEFVRPHCKELSDAILRIPEVSSALDMSIERVTLSQAVDAPEDMVDSIVERLDGKFPDGLSLYPFQYVGVAFCEAANGRALIGDEMGIGKTIQAIAYSVLHPEQWPVLVVAPANVKYNWANEIAKWIPDASLCVIKNGKSELEGADFTIINYDLMAKKQDELLAEGYNLVIMDESHYIKNPKAQRTEACIALAQQAKGLICLTGTPITNRPAEFYTQLNLLRPNQFSSWWSYAKRYCDAKQTRFGWKTDGASNLSELNERARDFMVRRLLTEVIPEMPDLVEQYVPVELDDNDWHSYQECLHQWQEQYEYYLDHPPMPAGFVLNMLTDLRHECGRLKTTFAANYILDYVQQTGKQIVVFTHHRDVMDAIAAQLTDQLHLLTRGNGFDIIRGGVSAQQRTKTVEAFQNGNLDVLLCATVAAKEGITLTNADTVVFVEREWVPGWESQAAHRIRRIGQESSFCRQVFLSVPNSIDAKFDAVVKSKAAVVKAAMDGDDERRAEGAIVSDLLARLKADNGWRNE